VGSQGLPGPKGDRGDAGPRGLPGPAGARGPAGSFDTQARARLEYVERELAALTEILFRETTTLGLRRQMTERRRLPREIREVQTRFGPARVKVAFADGQVLRAVPEYDDCKHLAEANGVPLREVLAEAERLAQGGN